MKQIKFKKFIALLFSMIICASFCLAGNTVSAVWHDFDGPCTTIYFEPNTGINSKATLSITNWAEEELDTDLAAHTIAYRSDYDEYTLRIVTSVELNVTLSDYYTIYGTSDSTDEPVNGIIDAFADGRECLNYEDHYSIIFFDSTHQIHRTYRDYKVLQGWYTIEDEQQGPTISIGFTQ